MASGQGSVLELAILGSLHESPMHGYELRKQLNALLGMFRAFTYGSLYPCLRSLLERRAHRGGATRAAAPTRSLAGRQIEDRLQDHRGGQGALPGAARPGRARDLRGRELRRALRVLRPHRRRRPACASSKAAAAGSRSAARACATCSGPRRRAARRYTLELQRHGLDAVEREVRWLEELIANERSGQTPGQRPAGAEPTIPPSDTPER